MKRILLACVLVSCRRAATPQQPPKVPLVIRLSGTEAEAGRALLVGAPLTSRATMDDAAKEAVRLAS